MNSPISGRLRAALLCALLAGAPAGAADPAELPGRDVGSLLEMARQANPAFAAERHDADAARERVGAAGALPDPRFQIELMDATNTMRGGGTSILPGEVGETRYRILQELPGWGKRDLQKQAGEARAGQAAAALDGAWLELATTVKSAWLRYYGADREAALLRESLTLLGGLEDAALARYRQGLLPQQAVLRAQREITTERLAQVGIEGRRRGAVAALNALLARSPDAPLAAPAEPPPLPAELDAAQLVARARANNPAVTADSRAIDAARAERESVWADRYPDYAIGLTNNRPRGGTESWDLMFEVMIPLQQAPRRAREREAERMLAAADARRAATLSRLDGEIGAALATFTTNRDTVNLIDGTLLPQTRATRDAARAGFEAGRLEFDAVLEAERQLVSVRSERLRADIEARMALYELEKLVGEPL